MKPIHEMNDAELDLALLDLRREKIKRKIGIIKNVYDCESDKYQLINIKIAIDSLEHELFMIDQKILEMKG